jgi:hypothetical protein
MTIILDNYTLPEKGPVTVAVSFEIKVTAEEARHIVNRWLLNEVSYLLGADPPTLVVGEQVVWRVPAWIGFPSTGRVGVIGTVDVDVKTGELLNPLERKAAIERYLEEEVKPQLSKDRQPVSKLPPEYLARLDPPRVAGAR